MAGNDIKQVVHRPGPYKQVNKPHKGGKGKSKRHNKGKVDVKAVTRSKKHDLNRIQRRNQMNQIRKTKKEEVLKAKRQIGGIRGPPVLVTILPVSDNVNAAQFLENIKSFDDELIVTESALGHCHITYPQFKQRYTFLIPNKNDLHSVLDSLKVSQVLLLLQSSEDVDESSELLSIIIGHALPTTIHAVQGFDKLNPKKKAECRKNMLKAIETRFPGANLQQVDTRDELKLLMLNIGTQKQRPVAFRDNRFHMLAENVSFNLPDPDSGTGTLMVSGYVRGQPLNVNGLVHLPGWGTYQMSRVDYKYDPHANEKFTKCKILEMSEEASSQEQESLQSEVIPDPMEGEQTWPTQEELDEAELQPKTTVKKVAEGTSDYQAAWIVEESEGEQSDESDDESQVEHEESQMMSDDESASSEDNMDDTESIATANNENYDDKIDMDEEKQTLVRFKEERMNIMFPDEEDTPQDVSARVRYQKYRGLKSFISSPWDPMENLPLDYARIYRFENFRQTKKKVLKSDREGVEPGQYVNVYIKDVPQSLYDNIRTEQSPLVVYGLLPHEQKMSVINTVIRKHPSCKIPIKAKDTLIFHIGFSRFTVKPIFSEHRIGNKFKFDRYLPSDYSVVASFYAPVIFPPAPVMVLRQRPDGSHQLVATGTVLDVDPNRVVVKRVVLTGHAFKVNKRSAVIRFMFFNKEDIDWFKCVEVTTKCGRKGHIREALGTHGHMKCVFDKQIQSQDVVMMCLYKRVFPKWNYNLHVPTPANSLESTKNEMDCTL
ncbi:hypothetical protein JTE90_020866 [Oedothorax gibbosus]|uniref:Pre-rRNA-processing protein TSR1 homolog n=1 Tax=Oedothorax gibbosus TaxID=931172 RepID=A0AAV6UQU8_9ARAC|nr:hypothetical protein JTE90_020866 [Oedothorax gibbosus]